jgi:hypothetical protein
MADERIRTRAGNALEGRPEDVLGQGDELETVRSQGVSFRIEGLPLDREVLAVEGDDVGNRRHRLLAGQAQRGVRVHVPGEHEVIGGKRLAVVPGEIGPQCVGRSHGAVRGDLPAIRVERGQAREQLRLGRPTRVGEGEQAVEDTQREVEPGALRGE